jgi:phosphocarrier protein
MAAARRAVVAGPLGMHARAAARFAQAASRYRSHVTVTRDARTVDGKSILGLLLLSAVTGAEIVIEADGADAEEAVAVLAALVESGFAETRAASGPPTA